jgi:NTE family protein
LGAEKVIAVDISREVEEIIEYKRGISLILRAALLTSKHLRQRQLETADLVIRPEVGDVHWADFDHPERMLQKGREAALVCLDQIRALQKKSLAFGGRELHGRVRNALGQKLRPALPPWGRLEPNRK